jgi:hypothetical protein
MNITAFALAEPYDNIKAMWPDQVRDLDQQLDLIQAMAEEYEFPPGGAAS